MMHQPTMRRGAAILAVVVMLAVSGCTSSSPSGSGQDTSEVPSSATAKKKPAPTGPAATVSAPLTAGEGPSLISASPGPDLKAAGYEESEHEVSGTAVSYKALDGLPADGRYQLAPDKKADYATRILVRRPTDPAKFNGTVVVEWLNVSSGADAAPEYTYLSDELVREGYGWVGVSAQRIGIEGGDVLVAVPGPLGDLAGVGKGIKALDPARYGDLHHPGDAFSYDMYSQVAQAIRGSAASNPFHGYDVKQVLAAGESQSAFTLTTYADGVQPLTHAYDGFLIHSRGGSAAPLGEPDASIDLAHSLGGEPTIIRTDLDVPVIVVQTETDVLGLLNYKPAEQPDTDAIRLWEVAGTAHADIDQVGEQVAPLLGCPAPINRGQQGFVLRSAISHLETWAAGGAAPPKAPRLSTETKDGKPAYVLDENGNVVGGVRTPAVDAPVATLSGLAPPDASIICALFGSTVALPPERLQALYPTRAAYEDAYGAAADKAIEDGFVVAKDKAALLAKAQPDAIPAS